MHSAIHFDELYEFLKAAVMKSHRLNGLNNSLLSYSPGEQEFEMKMLAGPRPPSEATRERPIPCLCPTSGCGQFCAFLGLW